MTTTSRPPSEARRRFDVTLRSATVHDAPRLKVWRAEQTVREFQPLRDVSVAQLRADIGAQRPGQIYQGRGERFIWIVEADEVPCGWITLVVNNWEHGLCEIGYALTTEYQGYGLMTDSLSILIPELFFKTPLQRIEARCAVGNLGSQRVLEKLGFVQEGRLRGYFLLHGERVDHLLYGLLRDDYVPV